MMVESILIITILTAIFILVLEAILSKNNGEVAHSKTKLAILSQAILPAMIILLLIRSFTYEGFRIPSASMYPTIVEGDWIVVDKYSLGLRIPVLGYRLTAAQPQRGDIVVFRGAAAGTDAALIKRIIGLPGDHIKYDPHYPFADVIVPEDSYYVVGDNSSDSHDSRFWGVVKDRDLVGKARLIVFNMDWSKNQIHWERIGITL